MSFIYSIYYWLLSVKSPLKPKDLTKNNYKTTKEIKDGPIIIEIGNTISKESQNIGVALFIHIYSHECYIKCSIVLSNFSAEQIIEQVNTWIIFWFRCFDGSDFLLGWSCSEYPISKGFVNSNSYLEKFSSLQKNLSSLT